MQQILWIVFAICCAWPTLLKATPLTVIIDAGHGGIDNGATKNGHQEAEINLQVSRHLTDLLKKDRRFKVHMTRTDNRTLSLAERASLADKRSADVFLSIHVNSNPDSRARGAEFYFQNQLPPDEQSMYLAHKENAAETEGHTGIKYDFIEQRSLAPEVSSIVTDLLDGHRIFRSSQLAKSLKISWRGSRKSKSHNIRQAPFFVLSQMSVPSTLVELGFLTNSDDLKELVNPKRQAQMAEDLYRGLISYKESLDKSATSF